VSIEIPFYFDPIPKYFRTSGWFQDPKTTAFVVWSFSRCYRAEREVIHDNQKILLSPFSFIFGRRQCSIETGLTEDEIRTRVKRFEKAKILKKCPNKTPNRFTILSWEITQFSELFSQQNPQQIPKSYPISPHKQEFKKIIKNKKEDLLNDDIDFPLSNIINFQI